MLSLCRATSLDVEPVYTFRGHIGPVLSLAVSASGEQCFSGGMDATIKCWNIPSSNIDPYDSYGNLPSLFLTGNLSCGLGCFVPVTGLMTHSIGHVA